MLGKVIKHEFMDTGKVLIPLNLGVCGLSVLSSVMLYLDVWADFMGLLLVAVLLADILALMALSLVSFIYLAVRFFKSMFGSEAYLTHTLPASGFAKLNGKLFVAFVWEMLSTLLCALSVVALVAAALSHVEEEIPWDKVVTELERILGMSVGGMMWMFLLLAVISAFHNMLMIYASMSIGQLFHKHKVGAAVVTYIIVYVVIQIIGMLMGMSGSVEMVEMMDQAETVNAMEYLVGDYYSGLMIESMAVSAVLAVVFYIVTAYICNRKVNLD